MKCPDCGAEVSEKDICGRCGKKIDIPQQHVEVEYKEFTLSEFLEIRKKSDEPGSDRDDSKGETQQKSALHGTAMRGASVGEGSSIAAQQTKTGGNAKKLFFTVMLVLLIAAFITGAFFLLKFLFQP
jgi:hypothetical protein